MYVANGIIQTSYVLENNEWKEYYTEVDIPDPDFLEAEDRVLSRRWLDVEEFFLDLSEKRKLEREIKNENNFK